MGLVVSHALTRVQLIQLQKAGPAPLTADLGVGSCCANDYASGLCVRLCCRLACGLTRLDHHGHVSNVGDAYVRCAEVTDAVALLARLCRHLRQQPSATWSACDANRPALRFGVGRMKCGCFELV